MPLPMITFITIILAYLAAAFGGALIAQGSPVYGLGLVVLGLGWTAIIISALMHLVADLAKELGVSHEDQ